MTRLGIAAEFWSRTGEPFRALARRLKSRFASSERRVSQQPPFRRKALFEMLEQRLLLSASPGPDPAVVISAAVLSQAGQHSDTPTLDPTGQIVYLALGGASDLTYNGPVTVSGIDLPAFQAPGVLRGQEHEVVAALLGSLADAFPGGQVSFTTEAPREGEFSTVYLGGDGSAFAQWGVYLALSEQVDQGNADRTDNAFVFTDLIEVQGLDAAAYGAYLSGFVAHEVGHLLGYEHAHQIGSHADGSGQDPAADPLAAVAFKPYTHVEIARDVRADVLEDGKLTIAGHDYSIHPKFVEAMERFPNRKSADL